MKPFFVELRRQTIFYGIAILLLLSTIFNPVVDASADCRVLNSWIPQISSSDCCDSRQYVNGQLAGIVCEGGRIVKFGLTGANIGGPISPAIGHLTSLNVLSLYDNNLIGSIPNTIGNLRGLHSLTLAKNQLSGQIPTSLNGLSSLKTLSLYKNQFSGVIPNLPSSLRKPYCVLTKIGTACRHSTIPIPEACQTDAPPCPIQSQPSRPADAGGELSSPFSESADNSSESSESKKTDDGSATSTGPQDPPDSPAIPPEDQGESTALEADPVLAGKFGNPSTGSEDKDTVQDQDLTTNNSSSNQEKGDGIAESGGMPIGTIILIILLMILICLLCAFVAFRYKKIKRARKERSFHVYRSNSQFRPQEYSVQPPAPTFRSPFSSSDVNNSSHIVPSYHTQAGSLSVNRGDTTIVRREDTFGTNRSYEDNSNNLPSAPLIANLDIYQDIVHYSRENTLNNRHIPLNPLSDDVKPDPADGISRNTSTIRTGPYTANGSGGGAEGSDVKSQQEEQASEASDSGVKSIQVDTNERVEMVRLGPPAYSESLSYCTQCGKCVGREAVYCQFCGNKRT